MNRFRLLLAASTAFLSLPAVAQNYVATPSYPQSITGTYLNTPGYGSNTIVQTPQYGVNPGYGGQYGVNPGGQYGYQNGQYGANGYQAPYGQGQGQTLYPNGYRPQQNGQNGNRQDDVMTLGRAGSTNKDSVGTTPGVLTPKNSEKPDPRGEPINGYAKIVDGKTMMVGSQLVVLNGADAPGVDQTCTDSQGIAWECGRRARDRLEALTTGHKIYCVGVANAGEGVAATCKVGMTDIGKTMVQDGYAMSPRAVEPVYRTDETEARTANRGMWQGSFKKPWDVRAGK